MKKERIEKLRKEYEAKGPEFLRTFEEAIEEIENGNRILARRLEAGLTVEQFAELLNISVDDVYSLEGGDLRESREDTEDWINQALNSLDSKLSQPK